KTRSAMVCEDGPTPGAQNMGAHVVGAAGLLAAVADQPRAVRVLICYGQMVEDLAEFRPGEHLTPAHADGLYRIFFFHDPRAGIQEMDMLLDIEVAREPGEVVPVAHLVEHLGPAGLFGLVPAPAAIVVGQQGHDFAHGTVVEASHGLAEAVV